jgi:hypothetical protein
MIRQTIPRHSGSRASDRLNATRIDPLPPIQPLPRRLAQGWFGVRNHSRSLATTTLSRDYLSCDRSPSRQFAYTCRILTSNSLGCLKQERDAAPPRNLRRAAPVASLKPHAISTPAVAPALRSAGRRFPISAPLPFRDRNDRKFHEIAA